MKPAIVKFTVDIYAPGAVLSPTLTQWYFRAKDFHSRRTRWPFKPMRQLTDVRDDGARVKEDFMHVRVTSVMDGYHGVTDGELDRLLTVNRVDQVFDMDRIAGVALLLSPPYQNGFTHAGWTDLYVVNDTTVTFVKMISVTKLHELALEQTKAPG